AEMVSASVSRTKGNRPLDISVEHRAETKNIGPRLECFSAYLFRRHQRQCSHDGAGFTRKPGRRGLVSRIQVFTEPGEAEIQDLHLAFVVDDDVCGLDVTMNNAVHVCFVQSIRY